MKNTKNILNKDFYIPYIIKFIYVIITAIILESILVYKNYHDIHNNSVIRINNVIKTEGVDPNLLCTVVNCSYIEFDGFTYKNNYNKSIIYNVDKVDNSDLFNVKIYSNKDIVLYKNIKEFVISVLIQYIIMVLTVWVIYSWFYIKTYLSEGRNTNLRVYIDKFKLEGKLQNVIAESAYHEMMSPVAAIKTSMKELENQKLTISSERTSYYFNIVRDSLDSLESVLGQMSMSKHTKHNKSKRSLYKIIDETNASMQKYHINSNFTYTIMNKDLFNKYKSSSLSNGTLMNILNNQIKNALEAGSTNLVFDIQVKGSKGAILITDNGSGIKGCKTGEECERIFELGNSTKDQTSHKYVKNSNDGWFCKILDFIYNKEYIDPDDLGSHRGFGLYITRKILREHDGDIKVLNTSNEGTVFIMTMKMTRWDNE